MCPLFKKTTFSVGECNETTKKFNGRAVIIHKEAGRVVLAHMDDDENQANGRVMYIGVNEETVFIGTVTTGEKCKNKHISGDSYRNGDTNKTIVNDECLY